MKRKEFIALTGKSVLATLCLPSFAWNKELAALNIERLTLPPKHHFFGYYGINPWNQSGKYHLSLETDFDDRRPTVNDKASVGFVDKATNKFTKVTETPSFNLQQGSMMFWIDIGYGEEFTYNDNHEGQLISYAVHLPSQKKRKIDGPVAAVAPGYDKAIGLDFHRMSYCRPVVGYAHEEEDYELENIPDNDGLYLLDLKTGEKILFLSIKEVTDQIGTDLPEKQPVWFNHVLYNPSGERLLFLCRVKHKTRGRLTSLWAVNKDGSHLQCLIPFGSEVSHFDWKDENTILMTTDLRGTFEYLEFTDGKNDFKTIGKNILTVDGHCSYLYDKNWIVSDTYPIGNERLAELFLFNIEKNKKITLGKFHHDKKYSGVVRCDLHPRVSGDGKTISFDSVHEGIRQIYTVDISEII